MATRKRVFTLRLADEIFDQIEELAKKEHRSMTNLIEYAIIKYLNEVKNKAYGSIIPDNKGKPGELLINEKSLKSNNNGR